MLDTLPSCLAGKDAEVLANRCWLPAGTAVDAKPARKAGSDGGAGMGGGKASLTCLGRPTVLCTRNIPSLSACLSALPWNEGGARLLLAYAWKLDEREGWLVVGMEGLRQWREGRSVV
eukprot:1134727-Pelagomonas_calceolata.AAC.2